MATRPLEALYPVIYLDAIIVKIRDGGHVRNKALTSRSGSISTASNTCGDLGPNQRARVLGGVAPSRHRGVRDG